MPVISIGSGYKLPIEGLVCPTAEQIANHGYSCEPYIESATGVANPNFNNFNCVNVISPDSVDITITTDGGSFLVPSHTNDMDICAPDGCEFTSLNVSGSDISNVTVTVRGVVVTTFDPYNPPPPLACTYTPPQSVLDQLANPVGQNPCNN